MSYLKKISALTTAQIVTALSNFLSALLIAKMLLPAGQGQWSLYVNAYAFGIVALSLGLPQALTYHIASKKLDKEHVLSHSLFFALVMGSVFCLLVFILTNTGLAPIFLPNNIPFTWVYIGLGLHFTLLIANQLLIAIFHANKQFVIAATISMLGSILMVLLYLYFYAQTHNNYSQYFKGFIFGNISVLGIQLLISFMLIKKRLSYTFAMREISFSFYRPLFVFAAWIYITNLVQFLSYKMDVWFISAYVQDEKELGIYTVTASLAQLLWLLPTAFHAVIFTDIAEKNSPLLRQRIKTWTQRIVLLSIGLGIIGYLLSFYIVPLLFGTAYSDISKVLPYLLPGIIIFAGSILISAYFSGINRIDVNFKSSLLGFVLCLVLNYILIPNYGIIGAAISSSVSYALSAVYLFIFYRKEFI